MSNFQPLGDNTYRVSGTQRSAITGRYMTEVHPQVLTIDLPPYSISPRLWKILTGKRMPIVSQMKYYAHKVKTRMSCGR